MGFLAPVSSALLETLALIPQMLPPRALSDRTPFWGMGCASSVPLVTNAPRKVPPLRCVPLASTVKGGSATAPRAPRGPPHLLTGPIVWHVLRVSPATIQQWILSPVALGTTPWGVHRHATPRPRGSMFPLPPPHLNVAHLAPRLLRARHRVPPAPVALTVLPGWRSPAILESLLSLGTRSVALVSRGTSAPLALPFPSPAPLATILRETKQTVISVQRARSVLPPTPLLWIVWQGNMHLLAPPAVGTVHQGSSVLLFPVPLQYARKDSTLAVEQPHAQSAPQAPSAPTLTCVRFPVPLGTLRWQGLPRVPPVPLEVGVPTAL